MPVLLYSSRTVRACRSSSLIISLAKMALNCSISAFSCPNAWHTFPLPRTIFSCPRNCPRFIAASPWVALDGLFRVVKEELITVGVVDHQEPVAPPTLLDWNAFGLEFCAQRIQRGDQGRR